MSSLRKEAKNCKLENGIANYIKHTLIDKDFQYLDPKIYVSYGIHPKDAHRYPSYRARDVMKAVKSQSRCVSLREIGLDYSQGCRKYKKDQEDLLRWFLYSYNKEGVTKPLVIHCRDEPRSWEASQMCIKILQEELPSSFKETGKIYRHCFTGGWVEMNNWVKAFPQCLFGFTALLLSGDKQLEEAVRSIPLDKIMIESDAPLLRPHQEKYIINTPNTCVLVAKKISELKRVTLPVVLEQTRQNAKTFYGLP
jgi:TatD DNase family protein